MSEPLHRGRSGQVILGGVLMAAGLAIAVVFGGGLIAFLWVDLAKLADGTVDAGRLISTLLVGPIVGGAPALLGVVLVRKGWRRWYPVAADPGDDE